MERDAIQIEAEKRYAIREARAEAREEALAEGVDVATIAKCTGLSESEIKAL